MKQLIAVFILILSLISYTPTFAEEVPTSGAMMGDVMVVRPLSIAALGLGVCLFVVSAPFAAIPVDRKEVFRQTSNRFVLYPFHYAFMRKVGRFPGFMEEIDYVQD
ncbi:MAG: hypothetical protein AAF518_02015 [Spirochaetota bacterium]